MEMVVVARVRAAVVRKMVVAAYLLTTYSLAHLLTYLLAYLLTYLLTYL